jgi:TPP-dependent pyruvate/acetoin dehydrogenase alpha subunit
MTSKSKEQSTAAPLPAAQNGFSLISSEKLLGIYATMLKCRMLKSSILAERIRILPRQRDFTGNESAVVGQEAVTAGITIDLLPEDTIAASPGDLIPCFIQGLPLEALLDSLFQPIAPSPGIAARLKIATDTAVANKAHKNHRIAVTISSREPASIGPWHEALEFAGLHNLPMIFVSWGTLANGVPLKERAYSLPSIVVDGNDAVAVYRVAHEAIAHARIGHGPTLIECQSDGSNTGDPVLNMERYLIRKGIFSEDFKKEQAARFSKELEAARQRFTWPVDASDHRPALTVQ